MTVKLDFELTIIQHLTSLIYQIFSLILLVFSKTVQDKYSFFTNKSLDTDPFPNCKSLNPNAWLVLHRKRIILQIFSFPCITALKMKIKLQWNKILNWWSFNNEYHLYQISSLILFVLSKTAQDTYRFSVKRKGRSSF